MDYSVLMDQPVFVQFRDGMRYGWVKSIEYDCVTLTGAAYFVAKDKLNEHFCPEYFATHIETEGDISIIAVKSVLNITGVKEIALIADNIVATYYSDLFSSR